MLQVAQEGLSGSGAAGPGETGSRVRTSGLGSYPEIHVPVYAAVKGVRIAKLSNYVFIFIYLFYIG